jgi:uncharacterized protein DUF6459
MTRSLLTRASLVPIPVGRRTRWSPPARRLPAEDRRRYIQGALALKFPLASGLDAEPDSAALSVVCDPRAEVMAPDPQLWAARFLQAVVEVVASERPVTQLARWTDPQVFAEIASRRQRVAAHRVGTRTRSGRQVVATVRISRPHQAVAEVAARVTTGGRSRAIAARLDYERERWLCTAIQFG